MREFETLEQVYWQSCDANSSHRVVHKVVDRVLFPFGHLGVHSSSHFTWTGPSRVMLSKKLSPLLGLLVLRVICDNSEKSDPYKSKVADICVDNLLRMWHDELIGKLGRHKQFTRSMYPSRKLYGALFSGNFTRKEFENFCETHRLARSKIDKCPETPYRKMVQHGFGLADYICIRRIKDFAEGFPCLQAHFATVSRGCKSNCSRHENRSMNYIKTLSNHIITNILPFYMAGDCAYLKCMARCRRPLLQTNCGSRLGSLDMDALYATLATSHNQDIYEPLDIRRMMTGGFRSFFPHECRALAEAAACDTGYDSTTATSASTSGPTPETRVLIAVWTTDPVVEMLPASCNLEKRASRILCHFNSTRTGGADTVCQ